jgi:hypothetical protein
VWVLLKFMQHIFPWISLVVLLLTALIVVVTEKRKRVLRLEQSEEEARIQSLDIDEAQKKQLLKAVAPLPDSKEAYPLSDIPLRVVSALAKVFGFLKLVLLCGGLYSVFRISAVPGSTRTVDGALPFVVLFVFVLLAVLQIVASVQLTRGKNRARCFLIFMAVTDLASTLSSYDMAYAGLWRAILVAMSACTLWVLAFRRGARSVVSLHATPSRLWQKAVVVVFGLLLALPSPFKARPVALNISYSTTSTMMSSSQVDGLILPISRIYLMAGDDSRATAGFMDELTGHLAVPTESIAFEQSAPRTICGGDLLLVVSRTLDGKKVDKSAGEDAVSGSELSENEELEFKVNSPFGERSFAWAVRGSDLIGISSSNLELDVSAEHSRGSRKKNMEKLAKDGAEKLNAYLLEWNEKATIRALPDELAVEPEPLPVPEVGFMSDAVLKARYCTPKQQINLYQLTQYSEEARVAVSNELISIGWEAYRSGNEFFRDEKHQKITIMGPPDYEGDLSLPNIYLIHAVSRVPELPENYAADLCRDHYVDYISLFHPWNIPADVQLQAAMEFLDEPGHSATILKKAYDHMPPRYMFASVRAGLLLRFAETLRSEPVSEQSFNLFCELAKEIAEPQEAMTDCFEQIKVLYSDQICYLDLAVGTNGVVQGVVCQKGINERPKLVMFRRDGKGLVVEKDRDPIYLLVWAEPAAEEGVYNVYKAGLAGNPRSLELKVPIRSSGFFRVYTNDGISSWSDRDVDPGFSLESETEPWDFALVYSIHIDPESNELIVEATLYENEPKKKGE